MNHEWWYRRAERRRGLAPRLTSDGCVCRCVLWILPWGDGHEEERCGEVAGRHDAERHWIAPGGHHAPDDESPERTNPEREREVDAERDVPDGAGGAIGEVGLEDRRLGEDGRPERQQ